MRILQIFSRYQQFGGEEASVRDIGDALGSRHEVEVFFGSTEEMLGSGFFSKIRAPSSESIDRIAMQIPNS
jgi:hypothetical protein